jgi:hypothetical protein
MKTKMVIFTLFIAILLSGCVTNKVFDISLSASDRSTLEISYQFTVTSFDGSKVSWNVGFLGRVYQSGKAIVQIPSGNHSLVVDFYNEINMGNKIMSSRAYDMELQYDFLPMHTYNLTFIISGSSIILAAVDITQSQE